MEGGGRVGTRRSNLLGLEAAWEGKDKQGGVGVMGRKGGENEVEGEDGRS